MPIGVYTRTKPVWNKDRKGVYSKLALERMSLAGKGRKHTEEAKLKIADASRKQIWSVERKRRISEALQGRASNSGSYQKGQVKQLKMVCPKCNKEFIANSGVQKWCRECAPNRHYTYFMRKYNLSWPEYENMIIINNGLCWICLKRKAKYVDHCHKTGRVRGLLCGHCNGALPIVEDKAILERAIKYIQE